MSKKKTKKINRPRNAKASSKNPPLFYIILLINIRIISAAGCDILFGFSMLLLVYERKTAIRFFKS